jgi:pyruvate ferredoxin oxidoreductase delta subunit
VARKATGENMDKEKDEVGYITAVSRPVKGCAGDTGEWRVFRPVKDAEKCNSCLLCWVYCPEASISKDDLEVDYQYCKGCGICAVECPTGAMTMVKEVKQ